MDHFDHQQAHVFLPEELVTGILLRLPVESLVRFKIVCKNWCNMIANTDFVNKHFDYRSNEARLLVYHTIPDCDDLCTFTICPGETLSSQHPLHHLTMPNSLQYVIGPVRGLFLLCGGYMNRQPDNYRVALLNPATRECLSFFVPDSNQAPYFRSCLHRFGFGFDLLTGDFKVVAFWYLDDRRIRYIGDPLVAVYSLVNGCWKHLGPCIRSMVASSSTYVNGSCYWLCDDKANSLLSFDMSGEVFQEIEGPKNPMGKNAHLVLHNDSLAVILNQISHEPLLGSMDLLVMRQDGCWTKDLTFDGINYLLPVSMPLSIWKNKYLIVGTMSRALALYEPSTHEIRELEICGMERFIDAFSYKKSLVSVKGGNKLEPEKYYVSNLFQHFSNNDRFRYLDDDWESYRWCELCMHAQLHCTCPHE